MTWKNNKFKLNIKIEYFIFFTAIIVCYFPIINRPQIYYDDYVNIFSIKLLGNGFNLDSLLNSLKIKTGGFRPLSYLSFYLNHYLFKGNLKSFIIINVLIHFFNTIVFYKIGLKLTKNNQIAFFTALLWAVAPVNLFAVSYLVQRMTSLMALFGGIAVLFYLDWEENKNSMNLILALVFVVLSTFCKENGILFLGFFLIHYYIKNGKEKDIRILYTTGFLFLIFLYIFSKNYFIVGYIKRGTTPIQRFLTEMRVLVFYLQNIIFPIENKIYLFANLKPSVSLVNPLTTFFSGMFLIILVICSYLLKNKHKILTISILSFFLFHSIESTFLPLYTVFFHRNYIASFFVFLFLAYILNNIKLSYVKHTIFIVLLINSGWITLTHNLKWSYKPYYILKNFESYPNYTESKLNYAIQLRKEGKFDDALKIYFELLKTKKRTLPFLEVIYILKAKGLNNEVIKLANLYPQKEAILLYTLGMAYAGLNKIDSAITYIKQSLNEHFDPGFFFNYIALLYHNEFYDKVVFETENHMPKLKEFSIKNNSIMTAIYGYNSLLTKIILLKIECEIRINLTNKIKEDIDFLKKYGVYNINTERFIHALNAIKEKKYDEALSLLNLIEINSVTGLGKFINFKKTIFTLCIYDKTGREEKFKKLIEKYSKNTIIYNSLWQELDKCY